MAYDSPQSDPLVESMDRPGPSGPVAWLGAVPRRLAAWVGAHRTLTIGLVLTGGLTMSLAAAVINYYSTRDPAALDRRKIDLAWARFDEGRYDETRTLAEEVVHSPTIPADRVGEVAYLLGATAILDAQTRWHHGERQRLFTVAAGYLEESRDRGLPPDREGEALYWLGMALCETGKYKQAIPNLLACVEKEPSLKPDAYLLLSQAYFHDEQRKPGHAVSFARKFLNLDETPGAARQQMLLHLARMLFELGDEAGCREALAKIPPTSPLRPQTIVIEGQLALKKAQAARAAAEEASGMGGDPGYIQGQRTQAAEHFSLALEHFRRAQGRDTLGNDATREASYLSGLALAGLEQLRDAYRSLSRTRKLYGPFDEGPAAALMEAETLRTLKEDKDAIVSYARAAQMFADEGVHGNRWVTREEFVERLKMAYQHYLDRDLYAFAAALAEAMKPLISDDDRLRLYAGAHYEWGRFLTKQAAGEVSAKAMEFRNRGRWHYREAGRTFARLAQRRVTERTYTQELWQSAESLMAGRDYHHAAGALAVFLKNESLRGRPRALVAMGESKLALGELEEAKRYLLECADFHPKDPATYRARLIVSGVLEELGEIAEAKRHLQDNLHNESLTPQSLEWRDSLFALGRLSYVEAERLSAKNNVLALDPNDAKEVKEGAKAFDAAVAAYHDAIAQLSEAAERYPDAPQSIHARYMLAEAHRKSAQAPMLQLGVVTIKSRRSDLESQARERLLTAAKTYGHIEESLNRKQENTELTAVEKAILRNCYFAQGASLFELGRFDPDYYRQAIEEYSTATNRYQHEPEALEAFVQIAMCYKRLDRPIDARGTIEQAKIVLSRIRPDASFEATTRFDRKRWEDTLAWMSEL